MLIEVCNFQSIEHLSLTVEGFTALVGRSNIGKSALVRAVKTALTNEVGTSFIRHERSTCARLQKGGKTCKCLASVHIKRDGFDLFWQKSDTINQYKFNGKIYDKPGQGVPEFLVEAGLAPLKMGDELNSIQFADQFFPIFLLNESGPTAAETLTDVARLDKISVAMKAADKVRRDLASTKKVREKDVLALEAKMTRYIGLDIVQDQVEGVDKVFSDLQRSEGKVSALTSYVGRSRDLIQQVTTLAAASKIPLPKSEMVQERWENLQKILRFQDQLSKRADGYRALSGVDTIEVPPSNEGLKGDLAKLLRLKTWETRLRAIFSSARSLESSEKISVPEAVDFTTLRGKLASMAALHARMVAIETSLGNLNTKLDAVTVELAEVEKEREELGGLCPTCAQPLPEHTHVLPVLSLPHRRTRR